MPPKAKIPAPIDRPLSRAYLREFSGWSTAYPPGLSEPTSLREMENVQVNRDGSLRVRPGMRYLSYKSVPTDADTLIEQTQGYTASYNNPITLPPNIEAGDQVVIFVMSPLTADTTTLNGYTVEGESASVTGGGVWNYRLHVYSKVASDSNPGVPTLATYQADAPWVATLIRGSLISSVSVDQLDNSSSASTPASDGNSASLRVWATCNEFQGYGVGPYITPSEGTIVAQDNDNVMINIVAAAGTSPGPVSATASDSITGVPGWTMATLNFAGASTGVPSGLASDRPLVGTHEPFYLNDGTKAYLLAVRELDDTVGFRALVLSDTASTLFALDHPLIDFELVQPVEVLNFSADTTYVKYLQIDNKIFALSDNGEPMRVFHVGENKQVRALAEITRPEWADADKLGVIVPDADWILGSTPTAERRNRLHNPSFETNGKDWTPGPTTDKSRPQTPAVTPIAGSRVLRLTSAPTRTNLVTSPLHDVATTGTYGWSAGTGDPAVTVDADYLRVDISAVAGEYYAHSRLLPGVEAGTKYQVAFDWDEGAHLAAKCKLRFFGANGSQVGTTSTFDLTDEGLRWASTGVTAPKGAIFARVSVGGENTQDDATHLRFKKVVLCPADEGTGMFSGDSGTDYYWTGDTNNSASVYHPPADVRITSDEAWCAAGKALAGSMYVAGDVARAVVLELRLLNKDHELLETLSSSEAESVGTLGRLTVGSPAIGPKASRAQLRLKIPSVPRGEYHYVDAAMIETDVSTPGTYFDGATTDTATLKYSWRYGAHESVSVELTYPNAASLPDPVTYTTETLHASGGKEANPYSFGFFYTFNNDVGESAASKVTVRRMQRAWSEWLWETPDPTTGEPSGTSTNNPEKCADQLVMFMPEEVFNEALAEGAISWSLYAFTWSDQDPMPVVALKVAERELTEDSLYGEAGWLRMTPQQADITDDAILPTYANRYNYSNPSRAGQGLVAADRMILVNDPASAAVIRWSSNQMGEYTNFTSRKGGGYKTLTTGNLYVPACVKLWQNPQSTDTLTILCLGTDGQSAAYYMAPAQVTSQSDATSFMAFEETTATPGTTSPYGVEVLNNALYHPLDDQLMKSTASNYNISHKSMTDMIANLWTSLATKYWIVSSQHDNRLYYLVNNPAGAELEDGCKGNEVWVYDTAQETGTWSRFKIQAHALRKIEFGGRIYMSVIRPDGVYYLDPDYSLDDYVGDSQYVASRVIDWAFETNTQGANRAHDAWAHLQQVQMTLGNFTGKLRWGIKSWDVNGRPVDRWKITEDSNPAPEDRLPWDIQDYLSVQRDLQEWSLYASSLPDEPSSGQISLVQYRYTPVSVNVGYEYGSIETFEYARNVATGNNAISTNGVPVPAIDTRRP